MSIRFIPVDRTRKIWRVGRDGPVTVGNLDVRYTFNMDFERKEGRASLSDQARIITAAGDTLGNPIAFIRTNADGTDRFWALGTSDMFRTAGTNPSAAYVSDSLANSPNDGLDMLVHENGTDSDGNGFDRLIVSRDIGNLALLSGDTSTATWNATWWTDSDLLNQAALGNGTGELPLARLERLRAIGDGRLIHTIDQNDVVVNAALTLDFGLRVRCIYNSKKRFWIGARHTRRGNAQIIEWDGFSEKANGIYELKGSTPMCGWIYKDTPYFINEYGEILGFNGRTFETIKIFPMHEKKDTFTISDTMLPSSSAIVIQPHGVSVDGDLVYILLRRPTTEMSGMRDGLWIFNHKTNNLYHHVALGDIDANGEDFGQGLINRVGGIFDTKNTSGVMGRTRLLMGGRVFDTDSVGVNAIFRAIQTIDSDSLGRGYFVTGRFPASQITEVWQQLWIKFRRFYLGDNRIVIKYRTIQEFVTTQDGPQEATITWVSTNTFTSIVPTGVVAGDEVEVLRGDNAGCLFHITSFSATPDGSSSITVTLDSDDVTPFSSTATARVRYDNWRRLRINDSDMISDTSAVARRFELPGTPSDTTSTTQINASTWVEFKVELRGARNEVEELIAKSKEHLNI